MKQNLAVHRNLIAILACLIISLALDAGLSWGDDKQQKSVIKVAVLRNFPPQYSLSRSNNPQGFAVDIIKEIAKLAGMRIKYVICDNWQEMFAALKSGRADLIPNQGITEKRKAWFDFTSPVETFPVSIFVRKPTDDVSSLDDLAGRRVATTPLNVGDAILRKRKEIRRVECGCVHDMLFDLLSGNADAAIFAQPVFLNIARQAKVEQRIKPVGKPLMEIKRAISVKKGNQALLTKLDPLVRRLVNSAKYTEIYTKWYGKPLPFWNSKNIFLFMAFICSAIIIVMAVWRYQSVVLLNKKLKEAHDTLENRVELRTAALLKANEELQDALNNVKLLSGMLPICASCKKIRDDKGYWNQIEAYIKDHSEADFSHSICPECAKKLYPDLDV